MVQENTEIALGEGLKSRGVIGCGEEEVGVEKIVVLGFYTSCYFRSCTSGSFISNVTQMATNPLPYTFIPSSLN